MGQVDAIRVLEVIFAGTVSLASSLMRGNHVQWSISKLPEKQKAIVALAMRNGPLEALHAGKLCPACNEFEPALKGEKLASRLLISPPDQFVTLEFSLARSK
jgi:hypothetical protein